MNIKLIMWLIYTAIAIVVLTIGILLDWTIRRFVKIEVSSLKEDVVSIIGAVILYMIGQTLFVLAL